MPSLEILVDVAGQPRVKATRIGLTVAGSEWDGPLFAETWLIPKTNTLVCNPAPLRPEWHTSSTGANARWGLSDFGLAASDGWVAQALKEGPGAVRMYNPKGMSVPAKLTSSLQANRAVFVSYFCFNVGNDDAAVYLECGWSAAGNGSTGVSLRFWSGGKVDVYKDGGYLATHTLGNARGSQTANRYADLLLIPARTREITVYSITSGDAFTHVFSDIDEGAANPVVTAAAPFWWHVPSPGGAAKPTAVDVEAAPVWWHDGHATSLPAAFGRPPATGTTLEQWDNPAPLAGVANARLLASAFPQGAPAPIALSLVEPDGATPFAPNGAKTACLMRADLVGGTHTPFLDGAHMAYRDVLASTAAPADGAFDLLPYVRAGSLEVQDGGDAAEAAFTLGNPDELDGLVAKFLTVSNRPARVMLDGGLVIDGVTLPLEYRDGEHDGVRTVVLKVRDRMHSLRQAAMRERVPLDGLRLTQAASSDGRFGSAVEFLYRRIGLPQSALDLDDDDYRLPRVPSADAAKFCHLTEVGAHPFDELDQLHQDCATDWLWGARPTADGIRYLFKDPDGLSDTPDWTLYRSDEDALAAGADPDRDVYWSFRRETLEIEANEVRATGYDPRLRRAIQAFKEDLASKDPALAPADRPDGWLGEERVMGVINRRLTTEDACERVVASVYPKVSAIGEVVEWTCEMLFLAPGVPLWRGHLVRLDGRGDFRVSSLRTTFVRESGDDPAGEIVFRPSTYTGGTLTNAGGAGLRGVKDAHDRRAVNKTVRREGWAALAELTPHVVVAV